MIKIEEGKELIYENVISYRGLMTHEQLQDKMQNIVEIIKKNQLTLLGNVTTTTFSVIENGVCDMEILVPVSREINLPKGYKFKQKFHLKNAVYSRFIGNMVEVEKVYQLMNEYINERQLIPITTGYNANVQSSTQHSNEVVLDIYIGVSNNIL